MELQVLNQDGSQSSTIQVDESVFAITPHETVVHQAVLSEMTNSRQGTHATKNRALVSGGGKKPWKQKGRGVARSGSSRSPIWRGGGTVFGPQPHGYSYKLPRKVKKLARRSILSSKLQNQELIVLETLQLSEARTKEFVRILNDLKISEKKITILPAVMEDNLYLATRNMPNVFVCPAKNASTLDMIDCEILLTDKAGIAVLNEQLTA
ncbi:MAG: 50S ribosomal protein L4 [Candidatus Neomarinimicrobiota bacterium]